MTPWLMRWAFTMIWLCALQYAGFCERLMYQSLDSNLRADKMSTVLNGKIIPEDKARRMVAYARVQGWLAPEATS
jgi:hypothetical protein